MKKMKWGLLGGAALAVTATAARADDLAQLKAEIGALQTRVSQLEAQPQASMPSGYSLLSLRDGQGTFEGVLPERGADQARDNSGFTLSVLPTADMAPTAEVSVSGEIRTALVYTDPDIEDDSADIAIRARLFVKGKVDTAVGEVGGYIRIQADGGGNFKDYSENAKMNKAYGWWKFAPAWELMAGYNDNTGALQVGWDWAAASGPVSSFGPSNPKNEQMRLTYASGPLSFAISVEDADNITTTKVVGNHLTCSNTSISASSICPPGNVHVVADKKKTIQDISDIPNAQAYIMFSQDAFKAQVVGLIQDDNFGSTDWAVGGGATLGIGNAFQVTAGAVVGQGTSSYGNNLKPLTSDEDFWAGSVGVLANLGESTRLELGVGIEDYDNAGQAIGYGGGIYWDPVSQVTLGAGATFVDFNDKAGDDDTLQVFFGTWLRFP